MVGPQSPSNANLILEHFFQLDMQALAERGMMALPRGKQRLRFFGGMRLDPPFLGASDDEAGMESFEQWLRSMLRPSTRRPRLRPLMSLAMRFLFIGDGRHMAFPVGANRVWAITLP
jgi:hypothetical protein